MLLYRAFDRRKVFVVAVVAVAATSGCKKPGPAATAPPPEVYVATVIEKDVPEYLDLVGQTAGFQDIDVRARVEGFLQSVNFREGSFVGKGDLLYQIDPKPLEAVLAAAKADLATAETMLEKTTNDVNRYTPLAASQAVSQQELDDARSAQQAARSRVEAAKAAVVKTTLDLGYTRVTSPIDGLVGVSQVKPGTLVGRGESTLLTTVSQIDPIIFRVAVPEAEYLEIARRFPERAGSAPQVSGIELTLADGTVHPLPGRVHIVERAVNPTTGTLGVQLVFPNSKLTLRPGQYGRARAVINVRHGARLVPQRAVQELQNLYSVAVVTPDDKITFRNVEVGPRVDSLWVIDEGLQSGERVVAEGIQAISDGITVRTRPFVPPAGELAGEESPEETR